MLMNQKKRKLAIGVAILLLLPANVFAASTGIEGIVEKVTTSLTSVVQLVSMVAYVAGFMFILAAVMKFKQHKDNPTQVPVGTPVSMLVMGAVLMFAGNFIRPLGESIFGADAEAGASNTSLDSGLRT